MLYFRKTFNLLSTVVFFVMLCFDANAQVKIQDKLIISNGNFYVPKVGESVASIEIDSVLLKTNETVRYEFPVGLVSLLNYETKYCVLNNKIIAISFGEVNGRINSGPYFVAIDRANISDIREPQVAQFISIYKKTYHRAIDIVTMEASPLKESFVKSDRVSMHIDLISKNNGEIGLVTQVSDTLKLWTYNLREGRFIYMNDFREPNSKLQYTTAKLTNEYPWKKGNLSVAFSILGNTYVIADDIDGTVYKLGNNKTERAGKLFNDINKSFENQSLVVDKDNNCIYVIPKSAFLKSDLDKQTILRRYGKKIKISKK